ncbi:MAG: gamma-glutamylcyclotransferase [Burkholderiaceae bacterium]
MTAADKTANKHVITRERLLDGSLAAEFRANTPPGYYTRSEQELAESLAQTLAQRPEPADRDVFVFGYGSLMWNPALEIVRSCHAILHGYSRRFCLKLMRGRGSPDKPGVMLALDRGGSCHGLALQLAAATAPDELRLLWRREMLSDAYVARWVTVRIQGKPVSALTFVINRNNPRYLGKLPLETIAEMLLRGVGDLGTNCEYFDATRASLRELGMRDSGLERLNKVLQLVRAAAVQR